MQASQRARARAAALGQQLLQPQNPRCCRMRFVVARDTGCSPGSQLPLRLLHDPMIRGAAQASADRAPGLLAVVGAFAASRSLAPLLAGAPGGVGFRPPLAPESQAEEAHPGARCARADTVFAGGLGEGDCLPLPPAPRHSDSILAWHAPSERRDGRRSHGGGRPGMHSCLWWCMGRPQPGSNVKGLP